MVSKGIKVKGEFNPEAFRIKFKAFLAVLAFLAAIMFLLVAMINPEAQTSKYTGTIIGFVTGTLITLIFSYYFGNSEPIKQEPTPQFLPELKPNFKLPDPTVTMGAGSDTNHKPGGTPDDEIT